MDCRRRGLGAAAGGGKIVSATQKTAEIDLVERFMVEWGKGFDPLLDAFRQYFTPQTVWDNLGFARTVGIDEAVDFNMKFYDETKFSRIQVDMLAIAQSGELVLTERVDRFFGPDGKEIFAQPIMGILEVRNGKIIAWREYFNPNAMQKPEA